jgi:hypothetical protein
MHGFAVAALAEGELRFGDVLAGNADLFAVFQVAHTPAIDRVAHRLADLPLEPPEKARAVDRALVPAVEPAIHDAHGHEIPLRAIGDNGR